MNIRRQYHASNCTLTLEGLSNDDSNAEVISILLNAECELTSLKKSFRGGKTFLENLALVVNAYTQEFLSGLVHPQEINLDSDQITLEPYGNLHRLTWQSTTGVDAPVETVDLTTIQLFDLAETLDQFFLDKTVLPEFDLPLKPVSIRHRHSDKSLGERIIAPILGIGSVALSAIAFFFIEPPVVVEPQSQPILELDEPQSLPIPESEPTIPSETE